jgi:hypothetical protein
MHLYDTMAGWMFAWSVYLLATVHAAPAPMEETTTARSVSQVVKFPRRRDLSEKSVQITYDEDPYGHHLWSVWYGPQGVAVDPCKPEPFRRIQYSAAHIVENSSIDNPPFPPKETWDKFALEFLGEACSIKGYGQVDAPTLRCGNTLIVDFQKDAQFDDPIFTCNDGYKHHRGWTVEY